VAQDPTYCSGGYITYDTENTLMVDGSSWANQQERTIDESGYDDAGDYYIANTTYAERFAYVAPSTHLAA
jgi:hypothetical protein